MKKLKILFLTQSVSGSQIIRCYPFAQILSKKNDVLIIGPQTNKKLYFSSTKEVPITGHKKNIQYFFFVLKKALSQDIIIISSPIFLNAAASPIFRLFGKRVIFDIDDDILEMIKFDRKNRSFLKFLIRYSIARLTLFFRYLANYTIVASSILKEKYKGIMLPVPVNVEEIRRGRKIEHFSGVNIVYTGVLRRYKGIETLIEAFKILQQKINNVNLILVGPDDTEFAKEIKKENQNNKNIIFTGFQPLEKMPDYYATADVLVLSSPDNVIHRAQTPIKLIHYLASGKPIIATDVGDTKKYIHKKYLCKPGDAKDMAQKMEEVLNENTYLHKIDFERFNEKNKGKFLRLIEK